MNVARDLLDDLAVIGATVEPAGDRLILRAGSTAIPATGVNRVREAKADLIAMLALRRNRGLVREEQEPVGTSADQQFKHRTLEACIVEWLNQHPAPSPPGRCAWCGKPESPSAVVLPFGTEPGTHAWLHAECWPVWYAGRKADAVAALTGMVFEHEDLLMKTKNPAADGEKVKTVVANDPDDLKGTLKQIGGSQSDHWNGVLANQTVHMSTFLAGLTKFARGVCPRAPPPTGEPPGAGGLRIEIAKQR